MPKKELTEFQRRILEVEVKIAQAKTKQASPVASQIQSDLLNTSLERAERNARLESISKILERMIASRDELKSFNDLQQKLDLNRAQTKATKNEIAQLQLELRVNEASLRQMNNKN